MATPDSFRSPLAENEESRREWARENRRHRSLSRRAAQSALLRTTDVLAALLGLLIAIQFKMHHLVGIERLSWHLSSRNALTVIEAVCVGGLGVALYLVGGGTRGHRHLDVPLWIELRRSVGGCFIAGLLISGALYLFQISFIRPFVIVSLICLTCVMICLNRFGWSLLRSWRRATGLDTRHVLIIGTNRGSESLRRQILENCRGERVFKGFVRLTKRFFPDDADTSLVLGGLHQLKRICRLNFIDEIILGEDCPVALIMDLVDDAREMGIDVFALPGIHDDSGQDRPCERIGDFALIPLHTEKGSTFGRAAKRLCDLTLSLVGLIAVSPVLLVIAIAIPLDSRGPILYISDRVGRKGRPFRCLKFRTMCVDADKMKAQLMDKNERDGILFKMTNDPRVTRMGRILRKYSLDELPQIVNVIRGEMSLVGPRPSIASEVARYSIDHYRRLEATPGLTGPWQVTARHDPSFEKYVSIDIDYVENWSFWRDMEILLKTATVVCRGTGS